MRNQQFQTLSMKLLAAIFIVAEARWKKPFGCDPAQLEHYEITTDCKRRKGFNTEADENGVFLEKKGNFCRRQCKFGNLAPTTYVQCRCTKNYFNKTFVCSYQVKLVRDIWQQRGWVNFDFKLDGEYPVDRYGEGGRQATCTPPSEGEWGEWSDWSACDASFLLGESTRTRQCSTDYCGEDEAEERRPCFSCNGMPPRTQFEIDMGQTGEGNSYDCTDGDLPGSICTKSCVNNHLRHAGNAKFVCKCEGETCSWSRTELDNFAWITLQVRPLSCIQGCDAQPETSFKGENYILDCSEDNFDLSSNHTSNVLPRSSPEHSFCP